ncbi:MAG: DUF1735 domain-containing protein [Chitinophagaceae bacterium]|nr:DUF1735 domain-containing protein [Chitinophagaceae bacterium]
MQKISKVSILFSACVALLMTGSGCLKDKLSDDEQTNPDIPGSPSVVELPGPLRVTNSYRTSYAVSLISSTKDTTFDMVPVRLASDQPATEDIQVELEFAPALLSAYNDSTGSHLIQPAANLYKFGNGLTVTIPKGSREGFLSLTARPSDLEGADYGFAFRIKSVSNSKYLVSGNFNNAIVIVGVRNKYDGVYSLKGYSLRAGDAALTGNFTGASRGLITTGPNSVIWDDLAVWGDGVSGIGIGEPEFAVNPTTNKVTITSPGGAMNAPGYDSRYDPATRTFFISFTWGAGPAARLSRDTLTFVSPRP